MSIGIVVLLGVLTPANPQPWAATRPADPNKPPAISAEALADLLAKDPVAFDTRLLCGREDIVPALQKKFGLWDRRVRRYCVAYVSELGNTPDRPQTRWSFSSGAASFLVWVLKTEKDREIRNLAASAILEHVPDIHVRSHSADIVAGVKEDEPDDAILLLGKTGCAAARELLLGNEKLRRVSIEKTDMALAKLGDTERSQKLVAAFEKEKEPDKKARLAEALGYIGDAACVMALAREMRSDVIFIRGGHHRSLRVDIEDALGQVYPEVPVFWVNPDRFPISDEWYEKIEKWLEGSLKITWPRPRPPFFYIQIIPTPVPPPLPTPPR